MEFKITKPIRLIELIELFAGYGSQALALEHLFGDSICVDVMEHGIFEGILDQEGAYEQKG